MDDDFLVIVLYVVRFEKFSFFFLILFLYGGFLKILFFVFSADRSFLKMLDARERIWMSWRQMEEF